MKKLLISGSRDASALMLEKAVESVKIAFLSNIPIIVGDARGIDAKVIETCHALSHPYECYGATPEPRIKNVQNYHFIDVDGTWKLKFLTRDRHMADKADEGVFIWNGISGGTIYTCKYMQSLGKPVYLINFGE